MTIRELSLELKNLAINECNEDENHSINDTTYIVAWLKQQQHINARMEEQWLIGFLRGCKHSLERTKEKLDAYYTIRTHLPEIFLSRDPEELKIKEILQLGTYLPLPLTAKPDGPRVTLIRSAIHDPKKFTFLDVLKIFFMIMDILIMEDDQFNIAGQDTILDLTGSRLQLASQFTPPVIKKAVVCFQDAYPVKTKSLHFINPPATFDTIFGMFKRFMNAKLRERIMVHKNIEDVFKYVPQRVFPSDYGGEAPSMKKLTEEWTRKVIERRDWFIEDSQYYVTESKRPGKKIDGMQLFGCDGSFKQLEFD
ncbi:hypothetical protein PV327_000126 [Microctonus hyperodae]|uniref:CRAL-TRIO domain-containing protein n=1 Tax=Microctonus hyperodae TaxID=165561 RepID=A0AA39G5J7_MICHY|nr:hypothetical protein PV327_000126 [Microctonus hyperodae]